MDAAVAGRAAEASVEAPPLCVAALVPWAPPKECQLPSAPPERAVAEPADLSPAPDRSPTPALDLPAVPLPLDLPGSPAALPPRSNECHPGEVLRTPCPSDAQARDSPPEREGEGPCIPPEEPPPYEPPPEEPWPPE